MGKYLIKMGFLAMGRTRSRPEFDFFPFSLSSREFWAPRQP
jgi:hypothetical protein